MMRVMRGSSMRAESKPSKEERTSIASMRMVMMKSMTEHIPKPPFDAIIGWVLNISIIINQPFLTIFKIAKSIDKN